MEGDFKISSGVIIKGLITIVLAALGFGGSLWVKDILRQAEEHHSEEMILFEAELIQTRAAEHLILKNQILKEITGLTDEDEDGLELAGIVSSIQQGLEELKSRSDMTDTHQAQLIENITISVRRLEDQ